MKKKNEVSPELKLEKRTIAMLSNNLMHQIKFGLNLGPISIEVDGCTGKPITGTMLLTNNR